MKLWLTVRSPARAVLVTVVAGLVLPTASYASASEFALPKASSAPTGVVSGPGGNLWFTEQNGACASDPDNPDQSPGVCGAIGEMTGSGSLVAEYPLPTPGSQPVGIAVGPDGALWFAEAGVGAIGRLDPAQAQPGTSAGITQYPTPTSASQPTGITLGPDGAMWFTERAYNAGNRIGRFDPAQASPGSTAGFAEYCIRGQGATGQPCMTPPTPYSYSGLQPTGIVSGPDGRLWFTETNPYCSDPNLSQPTTCDPYDDGTGKDDGVGVIGAISTSGSVSEYPLPSVAGQEQNHQPLGIAAGPDGAIWFTEYNNSVVGRIAVSGGQINEYPIPGSDTQPTGIVTGPDSKVWFALAGSPADGGNRLAEIDPGAASPGTDQGIGLFDQLTPVQSCSSCPGASSYPDALASTGGSVWLTELAAGRIASQAPEQTSAPPAPPTVTPQEGPAPPPLIIQEPGPPDSPALSGVAMSDRRFSPTSSSKGVPTSARLRCGWVKEHRKHGTKRKRVCHLAPRPPGTAQGTVFRFTLNAPATVSLSVYRPGSGGTLGTITQDFTAGRDSLPVNGWLAGRRLSPGPYEAELVAKNVAGIDPKTKKPVIQTSRPVTVTFVVVGRGG